MADTDTDALVLVDEAEAARRLGDMKKNTLNQWRSSGVVDLPFYRIGAGRGRIRYSVKDIEAFLARNRVDRKK